jgi:hypothetical protein
MLMLILMAKVKLTAMAILVKPCDLAVFIKKSFIMPIKKKKKEQMIC